jgi:hypothetical protein
MAILLNDDGYKYVLNWNPSTSNLELFKYGLTTFDYPSGEYLKTLIDTTIIGGGGAGTSGTSGSSGTSGINGSSGTSGISGSSGTSGINGSNGTSGSSGANGFSSNIFLYEAETSVITGNPGSGHILWNNATQIAATQININHLTDAPIIDIDIFLALLNTGQSITIQDRDNSANYQVWLITSTPTLNVGVSNYWVVPVSLVSSAGVGTTNFSNNHELFIGIFSPSGTSGSSGTSGINGSNGTSGSSASNNPLVSNSTLLFLAANT